MQLADNVNFLQVPCNDILWAALLGWAEPAEPAADGGAAAQPRAFCFWARKSRDREEKSAYLDSFTPRFQKYPKIFENQLAKELDD